MRAAARCAGARWRTCRAWRSGREAARFASSNISRAGDDAVDAAYAAERAALLLQRCQGDERHHRDESAALAGTRLGWPLRAGCALVGAGSAAAVGLARRV